MAQFYNQSPPGGVKVVAHWFWSSDFRFTAFTEWWYMAFMWHQCTNLLLKTKQSVFEVTCQNWWIEMLFNSEHKNIWTDNQTHKWIAAVWMFLFVFFVFFQEQTKEKKRQDMRERKQSSGDWCHIHDCNTIQNSQLLLMSVCMCVSAIFFASLIQIQIQRVSEPRACYYLPHSPSSLIHPSK